MPKSTDKTKGAQKRRKPSPNPGAKTAGSDGSEAGPAPKQKKKLPKKPKLDANDGIAMSKQLAGKVRRSRPTRATRSTTKNNAPRICGNGRPMPSLADLEKMYEDSDYDTDRDEKPAVAALTAPKTERSKTPEGKLPILSPEKLMSPTTLKKIASKVIDILETGTIDLLDDDGPPPPVIPQKKPKKSDVPYIVGCKERPQVPQRIPRLRIGVGDDKYGVEYNSESSDDEEDSPKKRKRGQGGNISKSIFNAKSDEIAANLKDNERRERRLLASSTLRKGSDSPDSCDTVSYEHTDSQSPSKILPRPFSPLPSTSKDNETILKNDKLFNESLLCEGLSNDSSQNDIEIIEVPIQTVVVDDEPKPIWKAEIHSENEDDFCVIVEPESKNRTVSPIDLDEPKYDFYNNINAFDLTETYDTDICEVIDVDDILAENAALIQKSRRNESSLDAVTFVSQVEPSTSPSKQANENIINEILLSSNTPAGPVGANSLNIHATQPAPSTSAETPEPCIIIDDSTLNNMHPTHAGHEPNNSTISEVVINFFNQPSSTSSESSGLTSVQGNMINKITSWMSSIETLIRGQSTPHAQRSDSQNQTGDDSVIVIPSSGPIVGVSAASRNRNNNQHSRMNQSPPNTRAMQQAAQKQTPQSAAAPTRSIECPICMDSLTNSLAASTLCGHVFCMECIKAAIKANGKRCPTCRKQLKGVGYHQLFL